VDGLIDDMLAGPAPVDLVEAFALPVPSLVISELLGVPYADHDFFQRNSRLLVNRATAPEEALAAQHRLVEYLERLVADKQAHPCEDLLSQLAVQRVATGELSRHEAAMTGRLLLTAGHETTANMIALGTLALLRHPDQLARLRETDDPKLIAGTVEELLRYLTIVHSGRRRVALEDIEVGGRTIRAGEGIVFANDIGNRDTTVFADPDRLDLRRDARRHIAFGFGVHQCLGQPTARTMGAEVTLAGPRPVLRPFGDRVGALVAALHRDHGTVLRCGVPVRRLRGAGGRVTGVELADDTLLPADVVVLAIGSDPRPAGWRVRACGWGTG
jgi:cytochrome P450